MSIIQISNLTFAYEGSYDFIFEDASFRMDTDWKLGLVGRNGRGKTTLLQLFLQKYEYRGTITSSVPFDYFPYPVSDTSLNTEEVVQSIVDGFEHWALKYELSLLEIPEECLYRPFNTLSHGERTKVLLAALFLKDDKFLLIDEPTDHLDEKARETVAKYLQSKKGFILVSHDRMLLDTCVDHILSINRGGVEVQRGNFSSWFKNRRQQDKHEWEKNKKLKKEIKRLEQTAREKAAWSDKAEAGKIGSHSFDRGYIGHKAAKTMKRSKNIENRIEREMEEKSKLLKNIEKTDMLTVRPLRHHSNRLIELEDVSITYSDKTICEGISFSLQQGDRIALKGRNGSGKSSIISLCLNEKKMQYSGSIRKASGLMISYVSQDTAHLSGFVPDFAREHGLDESLFMTLLRKLDLPRVQFDKNITDFSSGQKKKVLIAKSLCERAHVYIWDEPLNFVDVLSRIQIEDLILVGSPTMLFVEHDAAFSQKIATKIVNMI